jgi:hypothetical protein
VAAAVKDNPADLINIALEELVRRRFELPAFSTLDRMAGDIRQEVNEGNFALIRGRMEAGARDRMLAMFTVDPVARQSGHDKLKTTAPRASITRIGKHLDHLSWLDGVGGSTEGWLEGIPASKIAHFAGEARALDTAEMRDFGEVKRIALEVRLLHQARVAVRDDLVTML